MVLICLLHIGLGRPELGMSCMRCRHISQYRNTYKHGLGTNPDINPVMTKYSQEDKPSQNIKINPSMANDTRAEH